MNDLILGGLPSMNTTMNTKLPLPKKQLYMWSYLVLLTSTLGAPLNRTCWLYHITIKQNKISTVKAFKLSDTLQEKKTTTLATTPVFLDTKEQGAANEKPSPTTSVRLWHRRCTPQFGPKGWKGCRVCFFSKFSLEQKPCKIWLG